MSEVLAQWLAMPVPVAFVVLVLALTSADSPGLRRAAVWGAGVVAMSCISLAVLHAWPDPAPAPSPVVPDVLQECYARGGVQMVLADGAWKCVTADQAG